MYQLLRFFPECDDILIIREKFRILVYEPDYLFRIVLRQEFQPCFLPGSYIVDYGTKCVKGYEDNIFKKIKFNISIEAGTFFMNVLVGGFKQGWAVFHKNDEVDRFHVPVSKVPVSVFQVIILPHNHIGGVTACAFPGEMIADFLDFHIHNGAISRADNNVCNDKRTAFCYLAALLWEDLFDLHRFAKDDGQELLQPVCGAAGHHDILKNSIIGNGKPALSPEKLQKLLPVGFFHDIKIVEGIRGCGFADEGNGFLFRQGCSKNVS